MRDWERPIIDKLSLEDAVYILSLVQHSASEDLLYAWPFDPKIPLFAPTYGLREIIIKHLYAKELIAISAESKHENFVFNNTNTTIEAYYPTRVLWELLPGLNICEKQNFFRTLKKLTVTQEYPKAWDEQIPALWRQITKHECFEYYLYLIEQRNFDLPEIGEKTHIIFDNALNHFSPAQVFNITWQAIRDTTDYIVKEKKPKYIEKNMFIGTIQRKVDRHIAQGWEVHKARRDFKCPRTALSSTFFDGFLRIGDRGFTDTPVAINFKVV
jgi:hypothetical protein